MTGGELAVPALLAAAAVAVLLLPKTGAVRARDLLGAPARTSAGRSSGVRRPERAGSRPGSGSWARPLPSAALAAAALLPVAGLMAALLAGVGVAAALRWRVGRRQATARRVERARAVEACAALAAELRAGRSPAQALAVAAELACGGSRESLAAAAATAGIGGDVAAALSRPEGPGLGALGPGHLSPGEPRPGSRSPGSRSSGSPSPGSRSSGSWHPESATAVPEVLRALAACWTVCAGSGSGLAAAVERLEQGLRAEQTQRLAVQAELAGPRATAGMLAVLPVAGLVLAAGLGADPLQVLLHTPLGQTCLVLGLALDTLGLLWTARLAARAGGAD